MLSLWIPIYKTSYFPYLFLFVRANKTKNHSFTFWARCYGSGQRVLLHVQSTYLFLALILPRVVFFLASYIISDWVESSGASPLHLISVSALQSVSQSTDLSVCVAFSEIAHLYEATSPQRERGSRSTCDDPSTASVLAQTSVWGFHLPLICTSLTLMKMHRCGGVGWDWSKCHFHSITINVTALFHLMSPYWTSWWLKCHLETMSSSSVKRCGAFFILYHSREC